VVSINYSPFLSLLVILMTTTSGFADYKKNNDNIKLNEIISKRFPMGGICEITGHPEETLYEQDYEVCSECTEYIKRHWSEKTPSFALIRAGSCIFCGRTYRMPVNFYKVHFYIGQALKKSLGFNYKKSKGEENRLKQLGFKTDINE